MKTTGFVWKYLKNYKSHFLTGLTLSGVSVVFMLILPQITQLFIDSILDYSGADPDKISMFWIWLVETFGTFTFENLIITISLFFLICALLKNIANFFSMQLLLHASSESCGLLRSDCFKRLAQSSGYPLKYEVYVNFTNDISNFYSLIYSSYPLFFSSALKVFIVLILLFSLDTSVAICLLAFILIMVFVGFSSNKKTAKYFNEIRNKRGRMQQVAEEAVSEVREIKLFNRENYALQKYSISGEDFLNSNVAGYSYMNRIMLLVEILKVSAFTITIIISIINCLNGVLSVGFFVLILAYAWHAVSATQSFIKSVQSIISRHVRVARTELFLKFKRSEKEFKPKSDDVLDIEIKNTTVRLNERKIFNELNLKLPYGKHYGIIIGQGEGKSAFAKMLLKFYRAEIGEVSIAGQNINDYNILALRDCFSYISQEPYIFEDTLLNNIVLFDDFDAEKLANAIRICGLENLIKKLPDGLGHRFLERGAKISSQERQQINFARAIYKNAPILLIDSAFNKYNQNFSKLIIKEFMQFYSNRTVLLLSERFEDVEFCDVIVYVKNGQVEEKGSLEKLRKDKKEFYNRYLKKSTRKKPKAKRQSAKQKP
ncbi:MAG: ABC transporter ATP-binding protein [Clostridia bacterium]|nr:ABC transporter ATP-binding protein [Clostridia bacterium]